MDIGRLLLLSGIENSVPAVSESANSESFDEYARYLWGENVVGSEEIFVDFEEFYSYVNSEYNIESNRVMAVKNVMDEFSKIYSVKSGDIGLEIEKGGKEAILAVNKGLDELEHGDFPSGLELITAGYKKATQALTDYDEFVQEHSQDIVNGMSNGDNGMASNGVQVSDFI